MLFKVLNIFNLRKYINISFSFLKIKYLLLIENKLIKIN